jgi:hypothetical protein
MQTEDIILEELRALCSDYNDHARQTGERLPTLEAQMHDLCVVLSCKTTPQG